MIYGPLSLRPPSSTSGTFWAECCVCVRLSVKCTGPCVYAGVGAFCYHSPLQILTELNSYSEWLKSKHRMSCSARYARSFVTNCILTGNYLACLTPNLPKNAPILPLIHGA